MASPSALLDQTFTLPAVAKARHCSCPPERRRLAVRRGCGASRCGTIIWANDKAKADPARGGTPNLVGTELFRNFQEVSPKVWKGKVFVPDLNRVFGGTGTIKDANTIIARGCLTGNFGCKSQVWTRVTSTDH